MPDATGTGAPFGPATAGTEDELDRMADPEPEPASGPPPARPGWTGPVAVLGVAVAASWLALRPSAPQGVAAVVDLLVLPAVLFAGVLVLVGRPTVPPPTLALFFGLGAVFAGTAAAVLERAAGFVVERPALHALGPLVEAAAISAPLVVVALSARGRRWTVADTTLVGLAGGLGFLVVQSALVTGAIHVAPDPVSPLLAGFGRVPGSAGAPATYFLGPALGAALVGLALGLGPRAHGGAWRWVPASLALALVVLDHGLFDWRLRHLVTSSAARSGWVDAVQRVTLDGRLAPLLLGAGLVAARLSGSGRPGRLPRPVVDLTDGDGPAAPPEPEGGRPAPTPGLDGAGAGTAPAPAPAAWAAPAWASWAAPATAVGAGVAVVVLARGRHLGFLEVRPLALLVALVGLGYALWHLPSGAGGEPGPDLRLLLGAAAVASGGLGVLCAFLPAPDAAVPVHGGLVLETVLGWGAHVGNLGFLLGLGGLAAPTGHRGGRRFGDRWSRIVLGRLGWTGPGRRRSPGGRYERWTGAGRAAARRRRAAQGGRRSRSVWSRISAARSRRRPRRDHGDGARPQPRPESGPAVSITIVPEYRPAPERTEFAGATVQDAIEAAARRLGVDLAHLSIQLVDDGSTDPARPGRPARVRVARKGPEADPFLSPPARDSITRATVFTVAVEVAAEEDDAPESVTVTLRATHGHRSEARVLVCARDDSSPDRVRYRSNPYTLEEGEDVTWARVRSGAAAGLGVDDGGEVRAEYRGERASVVVYDGWARQVVGVNRGLLELTGEHHRRMISELQGRRAGPGDPGDPDAAGRCIRRLEARLAAVDEGLRLLSQPAGTGPGMHDDAKAFRTTALLHAAMSVEDLDPADASAGAMRGTGGDEAAFRKFLSHTAPGRLWADGAYSLRDVAGLLGWERFADGDAARSERVGDGAARPAPDGPDGA